MRQPYWKPQHEVFIRAMLKYEDTTKAYRTAYPKASPASARVGGGRLYHYPHIRQRLEPVLQQRRREASRRALQEGAERERLQQLRRAEMRHMLYKVVMKKIKKKRVFVINRQEFIVEEDPSHSIMLDALVLDLRLEAGYDNWPVIGRRFNRIMARLLPPQKRQQPNVSEFVNTNEKTLIHQQTVTNSPASPIVPVISNEERNLPGYRDVATASHFDRNDMLVFRQHSVTNSRAKPIRQARSGEYPETALLQSKSIGGIGRSAGSVVQTFYPASIDEPANTDERTLFRQHSVTNSRAKPKLQARACEHSETALLQNETISGISKSVESMVQTSPISISKNP